jgi:hypothetical protein
MKVIPSETEAGFPFGALGSPFVNLVRTRLLEPGTVVSAERRMNTRRNVFLYCPGILRPAIARKDAIGTERAPLVASMYIRRRWWCAYWRQWAARNGGFVKRTFRTFTRDLMQLRAWLKNCKVTEVTMESAGQYWRPLWNLLEEHFEKLLLVNPQHIKGLNGHKTDPKDAQWIAGLLEGGKLKGSWVPPRALRESRDLTRQRVHIVEDLNRVKNRIEQLCQSGISRCLR